MLQKGKAPALGKTDDPTARKTEAPTTREAGDLTTREADDLTTREADDPTTREADDPTTREADDPTTREADDLTTREAEAPALRVQLERLERAVVSGREAASRRYAASDRERSGERGSWPLSLSGPGTAAGFPDVTGRGGAGWSVGAGRHSPVSVGEQRWAEEADRVFRRDSRRYDGNFYLY